MKSIVILISGRGSNMTSLLAAVAVIAALQALVTWRTALSETEAVFGLRYDPTKKRGPVLVREALNGADPAGWDAVYGAFRTKKEAEQQAAREALELMGY